MFTHFRQYEKPVTVLFNNVFVVPRRVIRTWLFFVPITRLRPSKIVDRTIKIAYFIVMIPPRCGAVTHTEYDMQRGNERWTVSRHWLRRYVSRETEDDLT